MTAGTGFVNEMPAPHSSASSSSSTSSASSSASSSSGGVGTTSRLISSPASAASLSVPSAIVTIVPSVHHPGSSPVRDAPCEDDEGLVHGCAGLAVTNTHLTAQVVVTSTPPGPPNNAAANNDEGPAGAPASSSTSSSSATSSPSNNSKASNSGSSSSSNGSNGNNNGNNNGNSNAANAAVAALQADSPQFITVADSSLSVGTPATQTWIMAAQPVSEGDGSLDSTGGGGGGSGNGGVGGGTGVHPGFVQYVDDGSMYPAANGQMAYPVYTVGDTTMYSASSFFPAGSTTPVSYSQEVAGSPVGGQILASGGNTYLIQQGLDADGHPLINTTRASPQTDGGVSYMVSGANPALDADAQATIAHATRVSPATVQWLMDNYETAEGVSLPRSTLYNHYLRHCADNKLDPVNAASFGKLIRSVFLGLRTRRLGTRGNSKYHYYGIRVKPTSTLNNYPDDSSSVSLRQQTAVSSLNKKGQQQHQSKGVSSSSSSSSSTAAAGSAGGQGKSMEAHYDAHTQAMAEASPQTLQHQQYLGEVERAVPMVSEIQVGSSPLPNGVSRQHLFNFSTLYKEHCESLLEAIYNLQFSMFETMWRQFWKCNLNNNVTTGPKPSKNDLSDDDEGDLASLLPSSVLQTMLRSPMVLDFIRNCDHHFYQNLVDVLIPDVLRPIPSSLTQAIRNFAKSLEGWLSNAMVGCPQEVVQIKLAAVSALAQTLRRYTSLNHLAQAARAVLQNSSQITQMLADLNRVDFHNVQEQASWVCQCEPGLVERLEEDFKATLQQQNNLEQWAEWLQAVVTQVLRQHEGKTDFAKHARQFLLKWSFYSSMVIRDLTLRSAASFGSFHLIRLLYDEYMFYLVEHKVASAIGLTPIAVMSQVLGSTPEDSDVATYVNGEASAGQHHKEDSCLPSYKRLKYETS
ncbi:DNA-binding protein RFX2-like isoform X3 [Oratosquilla oratoria]|uniref:DNA-binding protein RFX2-like isoform X3 n=1 Tax=Oratosquilla oratoria TaxID=337810 RepID=UPI003F7587F0